MNIVGSRGKALLVAGGTGFLGSAITRRLVESGRRVYIVVRPSSSLDRVASVVDRLQFVEANGLHKLEIPDDVDGVINAATAYGRSEETVQDVFTANLLFPIRLLNAARQAHVSFFLNAGTMLPRRLNDYAFAKAAFADYLSNAAAEIKCINFRIEHMYGPGDDERKFIYWLLSQFIKNSNIELTEGTQRRDFVYLDDVVSAFTAVIECIDTFDSWSDFEVGTGQSVSLRRFVTILKELVSDAVGTSSNLLFGGKASRPNEPKELVADTSALLALGWRPIVKLRDGLQRTVDAYLQKTRETNR